MKSLLLIIGILIIGLIVNMSLPTGTTNLMVAGMSLTVEIADENHERAKGLSYRDHLDHGAGMLFVFDRPGSYGFWMKNMNFPLDIIWIGGDKTIVDIDSYVEPESFPATYTPDQPSQYVLEVSAGLSEELSLSIGDQVDFEITP